MGRSVSTPSGAYLIAYQHLEYEDEEDAQFACDDLVEYITDRAKLMWPSLYEDKGWAGREDAILLKNNHAEFGMSEYCGLVAIWMRVRPDCDNEALAENWLNGISRRFDLNFEGLRKIGTASNGEAFFQKVA